MGCPIRRSRDQRSLASPPGFSQRATSFIASQCQGIHQMPLSYARSAAPLRSRPATGSTRCRQTRSTAPRNPAAHSGKPRRQPPPAKPRHARPPAGVTGRTSLVPQHSPRVVGAGLTRARPRFHEDTSPDGHSCSRTRPPLAAIARLPLPEAVRLGHIHKFALPDQSTPAPQTRQPRGSPRPAHRPRNKPGLLRMSPIPPPRWCQARAAPTAALIAA